MIEAIIHEISQGFNSKDVSRVEFTYLNEKTKNS
jgi:hypothetical protein